MADKTKISSLFPKSDRAVVIHNLHNDPTLSIRFRTLSGVLKERLIDFLCGAKTLPLTYDPFFKKLFNPDIHPERLESFISSVLKKKVKIKCVLSQEDSQLQGATLLILDIVVELEDGSIANVEIQKISYLFPAQRMSCYSADLLLRQYTRVKSEKGKGFTYNDLKKVYTIIIFEDSPAELKKDAIKDSYIHFGRVTFDTKIQLDMLQEFYLIPLDVFQKSYYPKSIKERNELNGWLALLSTDSVSKLDELVADYPYLESIIADMAGYLAKPEEVIGMFSDALRILDENTAHYMIEIKDKEIAEMKNQLAEKDDQLAEKDDQLAEKDDQLAEKDALIANLRAQLKK